MQHGDFTSLAGKYARYRPGYCPFALDAFLGLAGVEPSQLRGVDVGAGTGILARMLAQRGVTVAAVEPNDAMRAEGIRQNESHPITWYAGSAEKTGLSSATYDFVCMASSFHWPDFDQTVAEFARILKPRGLFMALWNTRKYESNPILLRIEEYLKMLVPDMKRISSGRSEFCAMLTDRLSNCSVFSDVLYIEGTHIEIQTPSHYIGLWESVNDVRVQAGEKRFATFVDYIREQTVNLQYIEAEYITRAWVARKE